jgi:hypothetical protein
MDKDAVKEVFLPNTDLNSSEKSSGMKRVGGKCLYCCSQIITDTPQKVRKNIHL